MNLLCNRYADAFFKLCMQENSLETCQNELVAVTNVYTANSVFRNFLLGPKNPMIYKRQLFKNVFDGRVSKHTLNFLMLLIERNRIKFLPDICTEFVKIADEERNILSITIISAVPLEEKYIKTIREKFKKLYNSSYVKVTEEIDASLIGGMMVTVGDKLFDASVKGKLAKLRSTMTS